MNWKDYSQRNELSLLASLRRLQSAMGEELDALKKNNTNIVV